MNRICLVGRITTDPELRTTTTGKETTKVNLAVNRFGASEEQQSTDFIPIVMWNNTAQNFCKYQKKGNQIAVEGELRIDNYKDKEGNTSKNVYVLVDKVEYLSQKKEEDTFNKTGSIKQDEIELKDWELPF
ncbi:MAG: single-stranded DNA-binding protein [Methanosphaera sp.]|nr:single-stranded DNA-binding protein [Methanosphaera sp.]